MADRDAGNLVGVATRHPACVLRFLELEQAVLGAFLIDCRHIDDAADTLAPGDFFEPLHADMFAAMVAMRDRGEMVSPVTIFPAIRAHPALVQMGGAAYLAQLSANTPALLGVRDFVDQLLEMARRRRLAQALNDALDRLADPGLADTAASVATALDSAMDAACAVAETGTAFSAVEAADRAMARIDAIRAAGGPLGVTVKHLPGLNGLSGGIEPGHLVLLAGRPGMGKTALAVAVARGAADAGFGVLFVSLEMGDTELTMRAFADLCDSGDARVPHQALLNAELNAPDYARVRAARDRFAALPLQIVDTGALTLARLRGHVRRAARLFAARGHRLDLVVIDYLQLMHATDPRASDYSRVSEISRGLKALAKQEGVGVLALAQLNRQVEAREDKTPQLADLRESGQLEQDADTVLFVLRPAYYLERQSFDDAEREAKRLTALERVRFDLRVICAKKRNGRIGQRRLMFRAETQAVREFERADAPDGREW